MLSWRTAREGTWGGGGDGGYTIYRFPGEHVVAAWLCVRADRPATTILEVVSLVLGHQNSRRCTECGSGAPAPHRPYLWPREKS